MAKLIAKPELPKEIFQVIAKPQLLAQSVRVYLANQRQGTQSVLTRADISRTRKKLYKQKGTGGARHGDRKSPIFVGGGIAFAPKPRDHSLKMSKTSGQKAFLGALSEKAKDGQISLVSDLSKFSGKTSEMANFLTTLSLPTKKLLIITDTVRDNIYRSARNIPGVTVSPAKLAHTYEILKADHLLIMEEAIAEFQNRVGLETKPVKKTKSKK